MASIARKSKLLGPKAFARLEIRPDRDYVLLEGSMAETRDAPFKVSGSVILTSNETSNIKNGLWIVLQGFRKTMHAWRKRSMGDVVPQRIVNAAVFLRKQVELKDPVTREAVRKLKPGTTEYRYSFTLDGDTSESIEGIPGQCVEYDLKAFAERPRFSSRLQAQHHLRIVRTLGSAAQDELRDRQETIGNWDGKCSYKFGTTSRAAIFGDHIGIDLSLMPHEAKLEAGKIEITLQEKQKVRTTPSAHNYRDWPDAQDGWWVTERLIDVQVFRCPPGSRQSDADTGNDKIQASFKFKLPPNLTRCRQTVDHHPSINFKHSLHYTIDIINPDGHVSQLKTHHNVRIFISPHLPIGPRNEVSSIPQDSAGANRPTLLESLQEAPPTYGRHTLDAVFNGVPFTGYQTPATSSQPVTPVQLSRRASTDRRQGLGSNLNINNQAIDSNATVSAHEAHAQDLTDRLQSLRDFSLSRGESRLREAESAEVSPSASRSASVTMMPPLDRSDPAAIAAPSTIATFDRPGNGGYIDVRSNAGQNDSSISTADGGYDMEALERLTSYNTAVRTPVWAASVDGPPSYEDVTSRSVSPG